MSDELKPHPHATLIVEFGRQLAAGEIAAGWWQWYVGAAKSRTDSHPGFAPTSTYRYEMTDKHPQYKPKKKLIDMAALPQGTHVQALPWPDTQVVCGRYPIGTMALYGHEAGFNPKDLRLSNNQPWMQWVIPPGNKCPLPDGIIVATVHRDGHRLLCATHDMLHNSWLHAREPDDIIAYRIEGCADGYTDDPAEAA